MTPKTSVVPLLFHPSVPLSACVSLTVPLCLSISVPLLLSSLCSERSHLQLCQGVSGGGGEPSFPQL